MERKVFTIEIVLEKRSGQWYPRSDLAGRSPEGWTEVVNAVEDGLRMALGCFKLVDSDGEVAAAPMLAMVADLPPLDPKRRVRVLDNKNEEIA